MHKSWDPLAVPTFFHYLPESHKNRPTNPARDVAVFNDDIDSMAVAIDNKFTELSSILCKLVPSIPNPSTSIVRSNHHCTMSKKYLATPKPAPELTIPQSDKFVKVSIIDRYLAIICLLHDLWFHSDTVAAHHMSTCPSICS